MIFVAELPRESAQVLGIEARKERDCVGCRRSDVKHQAGAKYGVTKVSDTRKLTRNEITALH
jgi:hypothetical protein